MDEEEIDKAVKDIYNWYRNEKYGMEDCIIITRRLYATLIYQKEQQILKKESETRWITKKW